MNSPYSRSVATAIGADDSEFPARRSRARRRYARRGSTRPGPGRARRTPTGGRLGRASRRRARHRGHRRRRRLRRPREVDRTSRDPARPGVGRRHDLRAAARELRAAARPKPHRRVPLRAK
ncbi:MAG: hypothetical protein E6G50_12690 [Actinobacteria bacterium]|nr:MAG: hypothetical protein E6G50_12690 [Actinomycetota bacterium]